jgi:NitT/TauT family transport system ATP-binding protein
VGPSGCGKTTFLRIIAGLDSATSGAIETPSGAMRSAMVFQGRSVFPWLTVEQNVAYGLRLSGVPRKERRERVANLISTVGLGKFTDAFPHQLSEGMRQRVAIARALAVDPDLLLLDEPFSALDEQTKILLQEEVLRLWETSGKTVVFVTHSIDEGLVMGDRIVVMTAQPGTIKAEVDVPFDRPRHLREVRSNPAFADRFGAVWELLRDEVARSRVQAGEL